MADDDKVEVQGSSGFVLLRVSNSVGGVTGGKVFLIPENSLAQFELNTQNEGEFGQTLSGVLHDIDFAVFWRIMVLGGSAG